MASKYISVHYSYTPEVYLLKHLSPLLRYRIPEAVAPLVATLGAGRTRQGAGAGGDRLPHPQALHNLHAAIALMEQRVVEEPEWLSATHVRVERDADSLPTPLTCGTTLKSTPVLVGANAPATAALVVDAECDLASTSSATARQDGEQQPLLIAATPVPRTTIVGTPVTAIGGSADSAKASPRGSMEGDSGVVTDCANATDCRQAIET